MKKRTGFIALLSVFAISGATAGAAMMSGCNNSAGKIDAPANLEEELGAYVIPDYEVVDKNGMILAGYNVYLKSVKNPDGEELAESYGSAVTVDEAGVYSFVYSAGSKKVKDVTVSIDFADRTAPTINCDDSTIPKFYIRGNSYKVPQYTLSGDFDRSKCWAKVYYIADDGKETEVKIDGGRFLVDNSSGSYAIRIHVEDAAGNSNDYEYLRKVDGPENLVEHKVLYLDEEFGARQVSCYQSAYKGGYVSKSEEGAHVYEDGNENGAYKVSFDGKTETQHNEGLVVMDVPAIIDINEYEELYMYVYNDSENDIRMGSQWWNDTDVPAGKWTRLSWNTRAWGNNVSANNVKQIGLVDISGMTIRFIFDYDHKVIPSGDFYLSAMYGTPKIKSELETGENVLLGGSKYYINDLVELSASPIDGKTVDYYKVDDEIIPGDNFIATKEKHKIEVVYADGELTKDNMTWAQPDEFDVQGNDNQWQTLGISDYFVYTLDIYGAGSGWCYAGIQVGNNGQLLGFEISDETHSKFAGYGALWKWGDGVKLSKAQYDAIRGATEDNPVKAIFVRRGEEIRTFLKYGENLDFIANVDNSTLGITENQYGYGQRNGPTNASHNAAIVGGETKTLLYFESFAATVTPADDKVTVEGDKFYIGDTVSLKGETPPDGQMLAYFNVNGQRITGSSFVITKAQTTVEAVYTNASTLTLAEGIQTSDGQTGEVKVATDSYVTLVFVGEAPAGKVCIGFKVNGTDVMTDTVLVTGDLTVEVLFGDAQSVKLNDISVAVGGEGLKFDGLGDEGADKWAPASVEYVTDYSYSGPDGAVERNSLLKLTTQKGENSFALTNGVDNLDGYEEIYYYVYTTASGVKAGGWWCNDTDIKPNTWTKISFKRNLNPTDIINNGTQSVWKGGLKNFAIRIFNAPENVTVYVTAVYGVPFASVTVTKDAATSQYFDISAPADGTGYRANEKVTLTCTGAPEGKAFASFTVGGEDIEGNVYTLTEEGAVFGVRFADISKVTVSEGVTVKGVTAETDGSYTVGKGVKVTLEYTGTPASGKFFDCFKVNNVKITGDTFVADGDNFVVEAVFATSADDMTWETETSDGAVEVNAGESIYVKKVGNATNWAMSYTVTSVPKGDWGQLTGVYLGATSQIASLQFSGSTYTFGLYGGPAWSGSVTIPDNLAEIIKNASEESPVTLAYVKNNNILSVYATDKNGTYLLGKLDISAYLNNDQATDDFGYAYRDAHFGAPTVKGNIEFVTGETKTQAFLDTFKVTIETENVTIDKNEYMLGDTVTLTAAPAPEGKAFSYIEVDGQKYDGKTLLLTKLSYSIRAVYNEISVITLGSGVTTENASEGTATVGKGASVKLVFNGEVPDGKYFKGFKVDNVSISGDTFNATGTGHSVEAELADCIQTGSELLNEVSKVSGAEDYIKKHNLNNAEYVAGFKYLGADGAVLRDGTLKVTVSGNEASVALKNAKVDSLNSYKSFYYYVYTEESGTKSGGWWCNDTNLTAGQWTKVEFTRALNPQNASEVSVWTADSINEFYYRFMGGKDGTVFYVTPIYGTPYADVSVTVADDVKDYIGFEGTTKEGQTITLSHSGAPEGKEFAYFKVNGEQIEGSTYTLGTQAVVISAEFSEISTVTFGDGVTAESASNGKLTVGRGATVTLVLDSASAPANKVFDRFEVDEKPIEGNTFKATGISHSVVAIFIDNAEEMTWKAETSDGATEANAGESIYAKKVGNATNWAMRYTVTSVPKGDWGQLTGVYLGATSQIASLQFSGSTYTFGLYGGPAWSGSVTIPDNLAEIIKNASEESPVTLAYVKRDNILSAYATDKNGTYLLGKLDISAYLNNDQATDSFGYAYRNAHFGAPTVKGDIEFVTDADKVGLYAQYANTNAVNGQTSENQIENIYNAQVHAGTATLNYVTEIPGTLPADVKEKGVLKVNFSDGGSTSLTVKNALTNDISDYDEVYFYVYVDETNFVSGMQAGSYWCGDTNLVAGQWTKITIYRDYENEHASKYDADSSLGGKFYAGNGAGFIFRLMGCNGKDVYLTSLYGKVKEPLVDESTTSYSVVGGNKELTAILNDNFFPDAE